MTGHQPLVIAAAGFLAALAVAAPLIAWYRSRMHAALKELAALEKLKREREEGDL